MLSPPRNLRLAGRNTLRGPFVTRPFADTEEAIQALVGGRVIIVLDSAERENEGDFMLAAEKATPEMIYFMLRHGCGQLCVPVAADIAPARPDADDRRQHQPRGDGVRRAGGPL